MIKKNEHLHLYRARLIKKKGQLSLIYPEDIPEIKQTMRKISLKYQVNQKKVDEILLRKNQQQSRVVGAQLIDQTLDQTCRFTCKFRKVKMSGYGKKRVTSFQTELNQSDSDVQRIKINKKRKISFRQCKQAYPMNMTMVSLKSNKPIQFYLKIPVFKQSLKEGIKKLSRSQEKKTFIFLQKFLKSKKISHCQNEQTKVLNETTRATTNKFKLSRNLNKLRSKQSTNEVVKAAQQRAYKLVNIFDQYKQSSDKKDQQLDQILICLKKSRQKSYKIRSSFFEPCNITTKSIYSLRDESEKSRKQAYLRLASQLQLYRRCIYTIVGMSQKNEKLPVCQIIFDELRNRLIKCQSIYQQPIFLSSSDRLSQRLLQLLNQSPLYITQ